MRRPPKCSCRCVECPGVCTLRVFDTSDGELLWQKEDLHVIGAAHSGTIFGVRYRLLSTSFRRLQPALIRTTPNPITTFAGGDYRFQFKDLYGSAAETNAKKPIWIADIVRVATDGTETTISTDAYHAEGTNCRVDVPEWGMGNDLKYNATWARLQQYRVNESNLILGLPGVGMLCEVFDRDRLSTTHRIHLPINTLAPISTTRTASWVFEINGGTIRIPLYATAATWETALAAATGVASVTVTGGQSCYDRLTIDIEFDDDDGQIKHAAVENVTSVAGPLGIFDLETLRPVAIYWPAGMASPIDLNVPASFCSSGDAILSSGLWGTLVGSVRNRSWSRLEWTSPGGTPGWGTFSRVWDYDAFAGMTQIQTGAGRTTAVRSMTGVRDGVFAINSTACRVPFSGDFQTHVILDEIDGSVIEAGWNGLLVSSQTQFDYNGNWYFTGGRQQLTTSIATAYWEVSFVESYGSTSGGDDLRERDWNSGGIDHMIVGQGGIQTGIPSYQARANSTAYTIQGRWLAKSETKPAQLTYPHGFYREDTYFQLSPLQRFSESTEWRILHGSTGFGGVFTAHKTAGWYAYDVALATVKADLLAWYGTVSGGTNPIARVNPFGDDPFLAGQTPDLPTWQLIQELWILRDLGSTPNPLGPLAPLAMDTIRIEFRENVPIITKSMFGATPSTGVISWQRDVGTKSGVSAPWNMVRVSDGQAVVATECSPNIDPAVLPRGGS